MLAGHLSAEVTVGGSASAFYSFGFASEEQMVTTTGEPGIFDEKKNGYALEGNITVKGSVENKLDLAIGLKTSSMTGSPYLDLQQAPSNPGQFAIKLDHITSRFYISELLFPGLEIAGGDFMVNLLAGKFTMNAGDNSQSLLGLDSATTMVKMKSSPAVDLEISYEFPGSDQFYYGEKSSLILHGTVGGLLGEDVQRLFDSDGGFSQHGNEVLGEYAPQFFADLTLKRLVLSFGTFSASASYAYNAHGFYTGHSTGGSLLVDAALIPGKLFLPVSVSGAFYEKNIDLLGGASESATYELIDGTPFSNDTTDFRGSWKIGFAAGIHYVPQTFGIAGPPKNGAKLIVSGAYSSIGHIYRDTLTLFSLAIDGQYHITPKIYIGGGFILGTLGDATWKTSDSVSTALDDYNHTFALADNFGYEAYAGFDFLGFGTISVGFAQKKGLSMNYGIESNQSGLVSFSQKDSTLVEELWETKALFVKATIQL